MFYLISYSCSTAFRSIAFELIVFGLFYGFQQVDANFTTASSASEYKSDFLLTSMTSASPDDVTSDVIINSSSSSSNRTGDGGVVLFSAEAVVGVGVGCFILGALISAGLFISCSHCRGRKERRDSVRAPVSPVVTDDVERQTSSEHNNIDLQHIGTTPSSSSAHHTNSVMRDEESYVYVERRDSPQRPALRKKKKRPCRSRARQKATGGTATGPGADSEAPGKDLPSSSASPPQAAGGWYYNVRNVSAKFKRGKRRKPNNDEYYENLPKDPLYKNV